MSEQRQPGFTMRVLGRFQLSCAGVPLEVPTRKLACLLAFLACTDPIPQQREKLASLFWGGYGQDRARHNLRQALSRLRALLGHHALMSSGDAVRLTPGAFECDVVRFEALLGENNAASTAAAADLYGGALLEDVSVSDVGWNEWLLRERGRLSERAVSAIVAQGEGHLAFGSAVLAIRCGQRAIAVDSFREDAHRLVLNAFAAAGRNSEALRHFQELVALLRAELGAEPDVETRQVVEALGRGHTTRAGSEAAPSLSPTDAASAEAHSRPGPVGVDRTPWLDGAERRQMTVLICSGAPRAGYSASIDHEDVRDLVLAFRKTAEEVVTGFGGRVVASPGGAVHALFGYPNARERDAVQAVRAGIVLRQTLQDLDAAGPTSLQVRIGIAAGLVVIEEGRDADRGVWPVFIGEAPELALQLQTLAAPGEIIVSHETMPLLAGAFDLRRRANDGATAGGHAHEGWRVEGEARDAVGADARPPLVGRPEEFDLLSRRWEQVKRGAGRVVLLSGEPGIGKSHIAEHFITTLAEDPPATLRYFCSPHHTMRPLHPYIRQVERAAGLSSAATPAERLERLAALIAQTSTNVARDVSLLAELLSLPADARYPARGESPERKRELVMTAYVELLERLAAQQPVVVLFEDLHWIDPTSLDLLDRTITRLAQLPVLLIATFRPEHQPAWAGQPHVTVLHLNRLGRHDSAALIGEVSRDRPLPQPIVEQIIDRAEGVPLFVTELSKHLLESGAADYAKMGDAVAEPQPPVSIPTTLQAALSVRIEALGEAKTLALVGSVIGRQFSRQVLAAVIGAEPADLDKALHRMAASGLVSRRGEFPHDSYAFTHVLARDAAYAMILKRRRRQLHAKIADVMIDRFVERAEGLPEVVAHHLSEAGRIGEAADYWVTAGRAAKARWANRECADFFDLALCALDDGPKTSVTLRRAIDLRFEMKNALTPLGAFDRIIGYLGEAKVMIEELGDPQRLCQFQVHMCQTLGFSGRSNEAIAVGREATQLARSLGSPRLLVEATIFLAMAHFAVMDYQPAERLFRDVLSLLEDVPKGERFALAGTPEISARAYLTRISAVWGEFERGLQYGEQAVRQAEALEQPYSLGLSTWCLADLHLTRGDFAHAIDLLERGLAVSKQWDLPFLIAGHSASLGYAYSLTNRADQGLPLLERAVSAFETMRHQLALSIFSAPLGEAYVLAGRLEAAGAFATDALARARASGQRSGEASFQRILADVSARAGRLEEAEVQYREAAALADALGMRPLAARCRHALASIAAGLPGRDMAHADRAAATAMYRDMGMGFWLDQLEAPGSIQPSPPSARVGA